MNEKLCPTCGHPCEYKNGIMCTAWVCAKKATRMNGSNNNNDILGIFNQIFGNSTNFGSTNPINNNYQKK